MNRIILKERAREQIRGNVWMFLLVYIIVFVIVGVITAIPAVGPVVSSLVAGIFEFSLVIMYLDLYNGTAPTAERVFKGFENWQNAVLLFIIKYIFVFLWSLLLIVPGIVKSYSYAMSTYILAENPQMSPSDAIEESKKMMDGHKMELFVIDLSFIGWCLLGVITAGLAFIYVSPYMEMTRTNFYKELSGNSVVYSD